MSFATSLRSLCLVPMALFLTAASLAAVGQSPNDVGVRAAQSYDGDKEAIGLANGNVNIKIPLFSAKTRGGKTSTFSLSYNSSLWALVQAGGGFIWSPTESGLPVGAYGWQINLPYVYGDTVDQGDGALINFEWANPDVYGVGIQPPPEGAAWGGNAWYQRGNDENTRFMFEDGSQLHYTGALNPSNNMPYTLLDRNGNRTDIVTSVYGASTSVILNTGTASVTTSGCSTTLGYCTTISGPGGAVQLIYGQPGAIDTTPPTFTNPQYTDVENPHCCNLGVLGTAPGSGSSDPYMLTAIVLPNGGTYLFHYNAYY